MWDQGRPAFEKHGVAQGTFFSACPPESHLGIYLKNSKHQFFGAFVQIILRQLCHCTLFTSQPSPPCKGHRFISLICLLHSLTTILLLSEMLLHGMGARASALESQPLRALVLSLAGRGLVLRGHYLSLFAQAFSSAEEQLCQVSEALDLGHGTAGTQGGGETE